MNGMTKKEERFIRRIAKREANKRMNDMNIERPKWMANWLWRWLLTQIIKT